MAERKPVEQKQQEPVQLDFSKVKIKDRGDAIDHRQIGDVTVGTNADGRVVFVDFASEDIETE